MNAPGNCKFQYHIAELVNLNNLSPVVKEYVTRQLISDSAFSYSDCLCL